MSSELAGSVSGLRPVWLIVRLADFAHGLCLSTSYSTPNRMLRRQIQMRARCCWGQFSGSNNTSMPSMKGHSPDFAIAAKVSPRHAATTDPPKPLCTGSFGNLPQIQGGCFGSLIEVEIFKRGFKQIDRP